MMWMRRQSIILAFSMAVVVGSTSLMPSLAESAQDLSQVAQKSLVAIESISAKGEGNAAELLIKMTAPTPYTSYRTTSPLRLVIDLSQSLQGVVNAPVIINRGNFKSVTVSQYNTDAGALTRLDVELVKDADAVLSVSKDKPGEIRVSFPSLANEPENVAALPSAKGNTQPDSATNAGSAASQPTNPGVEQDVSLKEQTSRALTSVSVRGTAIVLSIKGGVDQFKTFRLSKPERFAIDLYGVKSVLSSRMVPVNALGVSTARLGLYPDKMRVVLDAVDSTLPEVVVEKSSDGLMILPASAATELNRKRNDVTSSSTTDKPVAAVIPSSVMTHPASKSPEVDQVESPRIEMIDFQVVNGLSRVAVKVSGKVVPEPLVKSPGFLTLTIKNANLPQKLQRSLESRGFYSPVLRVTPFQVTTRKGVDTKIRIALRKSVPYEYHRESDMLFIDFKAPENEISAKHGSVPLSDGAVAEVNRETAVGTELTSQRELAPKASATSKMYTGRKITLEFADAEVRKIFQLLSEVSNKNFVLGDDVTGSISIKLVNVPWDQALDIILDAKGLDKREDGNIIIIKGKGKFKSQAEEELELKKQRYKAMELMSETFSVNYADLAGIVTQFNALKSERGLITPDTRTNKVIVKDIPLVLDDMRKLLIQLDIPEKQVMIEARIVEASSTFTRSLGVNWGVHYTDASGSLLGITQLDTGFGGLTTAPPTSGTGTRSGGDLGISFGALGNGVQLDMRLSAAATAGLIKIVSSPKVATLNNKTAKITQGQQIPYYSSDGDSVKTEFIEAALALEVTPHINANGTISMKIDAKNDSMGTVVTGATAPAINKKQATTEMLLKDGETTVIGGIFVDNDNDSDNGVPFLMDIPLIGKFFKTTSKTKTKSELLVFITPRILGSSM